MNEKWKVLNKVGYLSLLCVNRPTWNLDHISSRHFTINYSNSIYDHQCNRLAVTLERGIIFRTQLFPHAISNKCYINWHMDVKHWFIIRQCFCLNSIHNPRYRHIQVPCRSHQQEHLEPQAVFFWAISRKKMCGKTSHVHHRTKQTAVPMKGNNSMKFIHRDRLDVDSFLLWTMVMCIPDTQHWVLLCC